jgi:hypothetical protein
LTIQESNPVDLSLKRIPAPLGNLQEKLCLDDEAMQRLQEWCPQMSIPHAIVSTLPPDELPQEYYNAVTLFKNAEIAIIYRVPGRDAGLPFVGPRTPDKPALYSPSGHQIVGGLFAENGRQLFSNLSISTVARNAKLLGATQMAFFLAKPRPKARRGPSDPGEGNQPEERRGSKSTGQDAQEDKEPYLSEDDTWWNPGHRY